LSRVYQTISRGFVNLLNAKKIQDTRFPFPYVQVITALLFLANLLTPLMMTSLLPKAYVLASLFSFLPLWAMFCLNFAAIELENPFGTDDNDLPMRHFQTEMNNCLMMLLHPNTDLIAGVNPNCEMDFFKLHAVHQANEDLCDMTERGSYAREKTRRLSDFKLNLSDFEDLVQVESELMPQASTQPKMGNGIPTSGPPEAPDEMQTPQEPRLDGRQLHTASPDVEARTIPPRGHAPFGPVLHGRAPADTPNGPDDLNAQRLPADSEHQSHSRPPVPPEPPVSPVSLQRPTSDAAEAGAPRDGGNRPSASAPSRELTFAPDDIVACTM